MPNEADTCRRYVVPRLQAAGWDNDPYRINEQVTFTDGRIIVAGQRSRRRPGKRADYILRYRPDFAIAVVEAKPSYATPGEGLQQAKEYAEILGLKFAYATNGHGIIEFDFTTGLEREITAFPTPDELWARLTSDQSLSTDAAERLLSPAYHLSGKSPRYYQEIAIICIIDELKRPFDFVTSRFQRIDELEKAEQACLIATGRADSRAGFGFSYTASFDVYQLVANIPDSSIPPDGLTFSIRWLIQKGTSPSPKTDTVLLESARIRFLNGHFSSVDTSSQEMFDEDNRNNIRWCLRGGIGTSGTRCSSRSQHQFPIAIHQLPRLR
jgi:hypothetical protein